MIVGGGYIIGTVCMSAGSLSVCEQHYCESDEPISLKLDVVIGPTSRKN